MLEGAEGTMEVTPVNSVAEGEAELSENDFDCILAASSLNGSTGIDFLKTVREEYGDLPVFLYAATSSTDTVTEAIAAGVTDYFRLSEDPEAFELLAHRIQNAVRRYRARETETALRRDLDNSYDRIAAGFFSVDTAWRINYANESAASLFNKERETIQGTPIWDVFPELQDTAFGKTLRRAMDEQEGTTVETYYPPHDAWFDVALYPDKHGVSMYFRQIDDRKQYEDVVTALHEVANDLTRMETSERICRRTIDAAENLLDFDFSIIALAEDGLLEPTAVSTEMPLDEYEPMAIHEGIAGETYRTGKSFRIDDISAYDEDHPDTPWRSVLSLPVGNHGNFQAVDETAGAFDERDLQLAELLITHTANHLDRVATQRSLEQKNERLNEFASIVSHDLRNPLNVATGRLELAAGECDSEHLEDAGRALTRMEDLIEDLLTLARQGEAISETETVSLQSLVDMSWSNVDVGKARLVNETALTVEADPDRLRQLFENLFRNAVDHAGEDVTVTIGDHETGFFVEDDGPGIDAQRREAVFRSGYSTKEHGTGFGLSIVREIVDAHGWRIRATEGQDGGTRFEIAGVAIADE